MGDQVRTRSNARYPQPMTQNSPAPCGLMEQIRNGPVAELGPRQGRSTLSQWGSSAKEAVEC
jgi:hypothetical protein